MFLADLRDLDRKASPEIQLAMQLFSHFVPVAKQRANVEGHPFEEAVLPVRLRNYTASLS